MNNLIGNYYKILEVLQKIDEKENYHHQIRKPKMSDKEIIALNLTAEFLGIDSEHHLFRLLQTTVLHNKIERSVYNRRPPPHVLSLKRGNKCKRLRILTTN